ncbi:adenylate/guanylate cyclase domain-containing protein [Pseudomonadota bacterium]
MGSNDVVCTRLVRRQLNSILPSSLRRRLAGILYADIARYSHLTEEDEEGTHHRVIRAMEIMTAHIRGHRGRISHYAGDAVLAEFRDATSALHCAIDVQANIAACNAKITSDNRVEFRIGVNLGEIIADCGDIYGNAVNIAARLESLADPGGICVSDAVRINTSNRLPVSYVSMGEQWVKNISSPVRAYRVGLEPPEDAGEKSMNVVQLRSEPVLEPKMGQSVHKTYDRRSTD